MVKQYRGKASKRLVTAIRAGYGGDLPDWWDRIIKTCGYFDPNTEAMFQIKNQVGTIISVKYGEWIVHYEDSGAMERHSNENFLAFYEEVKEEPVNMGKQYRRRHMDPSWTVRAFRQGYGGPIPDWYWRFNNDEKIRHANRGDWIVLYNKENAVNTFTDSEFSGMYEEIKDEPVAPKTQEPPKSDKKYRGKISGQPFGAYQYGREEIPEWYKKAFQEGKIFVTRVGDKPTLVVKTPRGTDYASIGEWITSWGPSGILETWTNSRFHEYFEELEEPKNPVSKDIQKALKRLPSTDSKFYGFEVGTILTKAMEEIERLTKR